MFASSEKFLLHGIHVSCKLGFTMGHEPVMSSSARLSTDNGAKVPRVAPHGDKDMQDHEKLSLLS